MDEKTNTAKKVNKKPEKPAKPIKQQKPAGAAKQKPAQNAKPAAAPKAKEKEKNVSGNRLMLLITIVNRRKAEYYADLMQDLGANLSFDYSWKNGFGLGVGLKEYYNIIQKKEESTVQGDIIKNIQEPKFLGGLYGFAKYKWFYAGTGSFFVDGLGVLSMYFNIGGAIPVWEMKKGKLGIDFGAEFWMTSEEIEWGYSGAYSSSSEPKNSPLNDLKIYAGVTYFLPL